jgi:hypothetical protein
VSGVPGGGAPATLPLPLDDPPALPLAAPLASTVAHGCKVARVATSVGAKPDEGCACWSILRRLLPTEAAGADAQLGSSLRRPASNSCSPARHLKSDGLLYRCQQHALLMQLEATQPARYHEPHCFQCGLNCMRIWEHVSICN